MRVRFTLVELMVVVAIIAILAAIAIPLLHEKQLEAKLAEGFVNTEGLDLALYAYAVNANESFSDSGTGPGITPGKSAVPWVCQTGCTAVAAWAPDGDVRCNYLWSYSYAGATTTTAGAWCDVDGDGIQVRINRQRQATDLGTSSLDVNCFDGATTYKRAGPICF